AIRVFFILIFPTHFLMGAFAATRLIPRTQGAFPFQLAGLVCPSNSADYRSVMPRQSAHIFADKDTGRTCLNRFNDV
ncbi:hypothetical protein, partial [Aeromonas sp. 600584]|uniref:hypothetical protein n=1 Tax=unclassified Aeromonas TaxID=257493 RepID=UPI003BA2491D